MDYRKSREPRSLKLRLKIEASSRVAQLITDAKNRCRPDCFASPEFIFLSVCVDNIHNKNLFVSEIILSPFPSLVNPPELLESSKKISVLSLLHTSSHFRRLSGKGKGNKGGKKRNRRCIRCRLRRPISVL